MTKNVHVKTRYRYRCCFKESSCVFSDPEGSFHTFGTARRKESSCTWNCSQGSLNSFFHWTFRWWSRPYRCIAAEMSSKSRRLKRLVWSPAAQLHHVTVRSPRYLAADSDDQTLLLLQTPGASGEGGGGARGVFRRRRLSCHPFDYLPSFHQRSCWRWRLRLPHLSGMICKGAQKIKCKEEIENASVWHINWPLALKTHSTTDSLQIICSVWQFHMESVDVIYYFHLFSYYYGFKPLCSFIFCLTE